jgi:hypothetical protein
MMSLEGTKTINERGKGVGLFFVMKDTGWKKHHKKGRLMNCVLNLWKILNIQLRQKECIEIREA